MTTTEKSMNIFDQLEKLLTEVSDLAGAGMRDRMMLLGMADQELAYSLTEPKRHALEAVCEEYESSIDFWLKIGNVTELLSALDVFKESNDEDVVASITISQHADGIVSIGERSTCSKCHNTFDRILRRGEDCYTHEARF